MKINRDSNLFVCPDEENDSAECEERADANIPCPSPTYKLYSCRWCKKNFSFKCRMSAHLRRCPMSPENQKQCPQCPAKLPSQRALKRHQVDAHCGSTPLKKKAACDLCGRTFAHPSGQTPVAKHTGPLATVSPCLCEIESWRHLVSFQG